MKQSLFWKLTKAGHKDGYILGTMHVKSERAFARLSQLQSKIAECELFAAEYDLDVLKSGQVEGDMFIPGGKSLADIMGKKKFARSKKMFAKAFNIDLEMFQRFFPLIIVNVVSEATLSKDYKMPLDFYLWNYASKNGLELKGIESYESQMAIIHKIRMKDQIKMVTSITKNPSKFRKSILKMADWYQKEEIGKLYKNGKKSLGKYKKILLKNRNYIMARKFEEFSMEKVTFFAVGAGHLAGSYGVLKLLKDKGWKLKAL